MCETIKFPPKETVRRFIVMLISTAPAIVGGIAIYHMMQRIFFLPEYATLSEFRTGLDSLTIVPLLIVESAAICMPIYFFLA